jgi:hypothetical protein
MKLTISILLIGLFYCQEFGQVSNAKTMILISTKYYSEKCSYVAFRISEDKIEIDNCYNSVSGNFNPTKIIELDSEPIVERIFKMSSKDMKKYEEIIDATNCDYIAPIILKVKEGENETIIKWKGIQNCYPELIKETVEELGKLFEKYK